MTSNLSSSSLQQWNDPAGTDEERCQHLTAVREQRHYLVTLLDAGPILYPHLILMLLLLSCYCCCCPAVTWSFVVIIVTVVTLTAELQRRIQAIEMRCYRKILGTSYKDHVTNEEVHAKMQQAIDHTKTS